MLRHLLMLRETLLQVAAEAVVHAFAIGTLQNVHVKHIYRSRKCWASPLLSFRAKSRNLWPFWMA